jgi:hypothetical protein
MTVHLALTNHFVAQNIRPRVHGVGALARHLHHAGSVSSVIGTRQYLLGRDLLVGLATDDTPRGMAPLMVSVSIVAADRW